MANKLTKIKQTTCVIVLPYVTQGNLLSCEGRNIAHIARRTQMKNLSTAVLVLLASSLAAAEPEVPSSQAMVLAYNGSSELVSQKSTIEYVSQRSVDRFLEQTLDLVAASLNIELEERISLATPGFAK
jgi:hypothetical protein